MSEIESSKQTASMEDYLETIAVLEEKGEPVTVTAISKMLGVRKPSVNWALMKLSEAGLVFHEKYKGVELTGEGARVAQDVYHRHKILRSFLTDVLDVDPATAEQDACRMEHLLSPDSVVKLEKFMEFVLDCHPGKPRWQDVFQSYLDHGCTDFDISKVPE
jgi:DtxR family Mn-dependent transcriptional regulator